MMQPSFQRQRGFTLLELFAALILTGGLIFALSYKTADVAQQRANQNTTASLALADQHLREFAARVGRLPCPDTNGTGVENCSASKGTLPYRTLGLKAVGYQQREMPIRYGVYRNPAVSADLATLSHNFEPTNADNTTYPFNNRNNLDFCMSLRNAAQQSDSTNYVYQQSPGLNPVPMAFMLAAPGQRDADGINGPYDGLNAESGLGFQTPDTPISPTYDDQTRGRGFNELSSLMRCEVTLRSLDLAANAIALEEEIIDFAESNAEAAKQGVLMTAVGTAISVWNLAQSGAALASAGTTLGIASGLLTGVTISCPIPPFLGCAFIPLYTAATVSAGTGVALSGAALIASAAAVAGQITATVKYTQIAKKTGIPDTSSNQTIDSATVNNASAEYTAKKALVDSASATYQIAQTAAIEKTNQAQSKKNLLETQIDKLTADQAKTLRDQIYGNPRPADIDPNVTYDPNKITVGAAPAIDAWRKVENSAASFKDLKMVDKDGNPLRDKDDKPLRDKDGNLLLDENGKPTNLPDFDADIAAAKAKVAEQKGKVSDLATSFYPDLTDSDASANLAALNTAVDNYLLAFEAQSDASINAENEKINKDNKATEANNAKIKYEALSCARNNQDYDVVSGQCTANPPGTASQDQTLNALCNSALESYNAEACAKLKETQTPSTAEKVGFHRGAESIVELLDAKGTLQ